jgi:hypothetical protein
VTASRRHCPALPGITILRRWQPVSPTLMAALARHAAERHAPPDGRPLRYADGRPVTYRRYDGLWVRIGRHLPWVRTQQISTHRLRHTTLTYQFFSATSGSLSPTRTPAGPTAPATQAPQRRRTCAPRSPRSPPPSPR